MPLEGIARPLRGCAAPPDSCPDCLSLDESTRWAPIRLHLCNHTPGGLRWRSSARSKRPRGTGRPPGRPSPEKANHQIKPPPLTPCLPHLRESSGAGTSSPWSPVGDQPRASRKPAPEHPIPPILHRLRLGHPSLRRDSRRHPAFDEDTVFFFLDGTEVNGKRNQDIQKA